MFNVSQILNQATFSSKFFGGEATFRNSLKCSANIAGLWSFPWFCRRS
jgi:hypothetical protein